MTTLKILSTGLIALTMFAAPAIARESHVGSRHFAEDANVSASPVPIDMGGRVCYPAPRVGAFATAPWSGDNIPCEPGPGFY